MESTTAYIISVVTALAFLLLSVFIANAIKFEGGSSPKDPRKRKSWFWNLAVLNPVVNFLLGYFVFIPDENVMIVNKYVSALSIGTGIGFVLYIIIGFVLSKIFKNGKLGNWF
jgi:sulfoxide reductase heme-binding subunit YedZ